MKQLSLVISVFNWLFFSLFSKISLSMIFYYRYVHLLFVCGILHRIRRLAVFLQISLAMLNRPVFAISFLKLLNQCLFGHFVLADCT